jgi:phosphate starvation-inducible protein PhoH
MSSDQEFAFQELKETNENLVNILSRTENSRKFLEKELKRQVAKKQSLKARLQETLEMLALSDEERTRVDAELSALKASYSNLEIYSHESEEYKELSEENSENERSEWQKEYSDLYAKHEIYTHKSKNSIKELKTQLREMREKMDNQKQVFAQYLKFTE